MQPMPDFYVDVKEFMTASKQYPMQMHPQQWRRRARWLAEEFGELAMGVATNDLVAIADGIIDTIYIATGSVVAHRADALEWQQRLNVHSSYMWQWVGWLVESTANPANALPLVPTTCIAVKSLVLYAQQWNLPVGALWVEVHRSNMAKAPFDWADGKLVKPVGWQPPDIAGVLRQHGLLPQGEVK